MVRCLFFVLWAFVVVVPTWLLAGEAEGGKEFHLYLSGINATSFKGTCLAARDNIDVTLKFEGNLPYKELIIADRLTCEVIADNHLVVDIERGSSRTRSMTNGGKIKIELD